MPRPVVPCRPDKGPSRGMESGEKDVEGELSKIAAFDESNYAALEELPSFRETVVVARYVPRTGAAAVQR